MYTAIAHDAKSLKETGTVEKYMATDLKDAVKKTLYFRRLADGKAKITPSGKAVISKGIYWLVVKEKE